MIARGDIRWFRFSAPDKRRPVLVLGNVSIIGALSEIPVVPLSTQIRGLPWEVKLDVDDGLPGPCALKPEWIKAVDRALIGPWIASLRDEKWNLVRDALLTALGFDNTPGASR